MVADIKNNDREINAKTNFYKKFTIGERLGTDKTIDGLKRKGQNHIEKSRDLVKFV